MDMDSRSFPRGAIRVSDAERDRAVAELSEHFQAGRLTQDEFEDRSGQALGARTGEDLSGLFTDLPKQSLAAAPRLGDLPAGPELHYDSVPPYGAPPRRAGPSAARAVLALVIVAVVAVNVFAANAGHGHAHGLGWLIPVLIVGFVFLRLIGHRRG